MKFYNTKKKKRKQKKKPSEIISWGISFEFFHPLDKLQIMMRFR